jgi:hypothetical protein
MRSASDRVADAVIESFVFLECSAEQSLGSGSTR